MVRTTEKYIAHANNRLVTREHGGCEAGAALVETLTAFRGVPDSEEKRFILEVILYVVNRDNWWLAMSN